MIQGFKQFIIRGNVIDLAVAVVIGTAFTAVVQALVDGLLLPVIAAVFGQVALDDVWRFTVNDAEFAVGSVLGALINFLLVALAIYLVVVTPMNRFAIRRAEGTEPEPTAPAQDIVLLGEIRDLLAAKRGV